MVESIITQRQSQTHEVEGGNNSEQHTFFCHAIIVSRLGFLKKKMKYDLPVNYLQLQHDFNIHSQQHTC